MASLAVRECVAALLQAEKTVAFAESASAGYLAYQMATVPDSGKILIGSIVTYDQAAKQQLLSIPKSMLDNHTAESAEVTKAMCEALRKCLDADIYLAITGLASPGGSESPEKPVGTFFIHLLSASGYASHREVFSGSPEQIIQQAVDRACLIVISHINGLTLKFQK